MLSLFQEQPGGQKGWSRVNERDEREGRGREEGAEVGTRCIGPEICSESNGGPEGVARFALHFESISPMWEMSSIFINTKIIFLN